MIQFDTRTNLLTIEVSPFFFASTGGLLGMFDNEPEFDLMKPDGSQAADVVEFANSWEVSKLISVTEHQN